MITSSSSIHDDILVPKSSSEVCVLTSVCVCACACMLYVDISLHLRSHVHYLSRNEDVSVIIKE